MLVTRLYSSPIGKLKIVSNGTSLLALDFVKNASEISEALPIEQTTDKILLQTKQWLDEYFAGQRPSFTPPLVPQGTPFQELVWQLLLAIPYGSTTTYGDLAKLVAQRLGKERMSAQAVGQAVGKNPIAIIISCHRVVGQKGQLTGYAGGLERKEFLLALENSSKK